MKSKRVINKICDKCLLAAANQAAGVVHRGTKNSFPRAVLSVSSGRSWAMVPVRRAHPCDRDNDQEDPKRRGTRASLQRAFFEYGVREAGRVFG